MQARIKYGYPYGFTRAATIRALTAHRLGRNAGCPLGVSPKAPGGGKAPASEPSARFANSRWFWRRDEFPSPRPSPNGRGRIVRRALGNPERLDSSQRGMRCSLSLRERVRVRGNETQPTKTAGPILQAQLDRLPESELAIASGAEPVDGGSARPRPGVAPAVSLIAQGIALQNMVCARERARDGLALLPAPIARTKRPAR